ncbi:hypothetical protein H6P81_009834 [Aristolochia fimbriata]|uniref:Uncharacterized protein n=1 Tax=Aristolochia fimbriata TaxID=158543 RepID=A0AAV7EMK8_ARIFI|nr:hypothetical protein H6P81_009834 [Aristolochia fimbriata]
MRKTVTGGKKKMKWSCMPELKKLMAEGGGPSLSLKWFEGGADRSAADPSVMCFVVLSNSSSSSSDGRKRKRSDPHHHHHLGFPCLHCHPHAYIRLVQHLIERCLLLGMNRDDCVVALEQHARIHPLITLTVWRELLRENRSFFKAYFQIHRSP